VRSCLVCCVKFSSILKGKGSYFLIQRAVDFSDLFDLYLLWFAYLINQNLVFKMNKNKIEIAIEMQSG